MSRPPRLAAITSGTLLLMAGCPSRPATAVSDLELHRRAIVIDTHSDCTQRIAYDGIDFARAQADMQVDLPKMRAGGLDAQFFSIFVGPWRARPEGYYAEALKQFDAVHAMIRANPDTIAWARTPADIRANAERKRISALFGVEGGHALLPGGEAEMLEHLRTFHARGARYLTLTWSIASPLGGSSSDDSDGQGLRRGPRDAGGAGGHLQAARPHRRATPARLRPGRRREDPGRQRTARARGQRAAGALPTMMSSGSRQTKGQGLGSVPASRTS